MANRATVGIRELRQNLSVYLRRVLAGETLEVTDRRRPVALVTPLPEGADPMARLVAEGRITPAAQVSGELGPPLQIELARSLSELLAELREDRF